MEGQQQPGFTPGVYTFADPGAEAASLWAFAGLGSAQGGEATISEQAAQALGQMVPPNIRTGPQSSPPSLPGGQQPGGSRPAIQFVDAASLVGAMTTGQAGQQRVTMFSASTQPQMSASQQQQWSPAAAASQAMTGRAVWPSGAPILGPEFQNAMASAQAYPPADSIPINLQMPMQTPQASQQQVQVHATASQVQTVPMLQVQQPKVAQHAAMQQQLQQQQGLAPEADMEDGGSGDPGSNAPTKPGPGSGGEGGSQSTQAAMSWQRNIPMRTTIHIRGLQVVLAASRPSYYGPRAQLRLNKIFMLELLGCIPVNGSIFSFQIIRSGNVLPMVHQAHMMVSGKGQGYVKSLTAGAKAEMDGSNFVGAAWRDVIPPPATSDVEAQANLANNMLLLVFEDDPEYGFSDEQAVPPHRISAGGYVTSELSAVAAGTPHGMQGPAAGLASRVLLHSQARPASSPNMPDTRHGPSSEPVVTRTMITPSSLAAAAAAARAPLSALGAADGLQAPQATGSAPVSWNQVIVQGFGQAPGGGPPSGTLTVQAAPDLLQQLGIMQGVQQAQQQQQAPQVQQVQLQQAQQQLQQVQYQQQVQFQQPPQQHVQYQQPQQQQVQYQQPQQLQFQQPQQVQFQQAQQPQQMQYQQQVQFQQRVQQVQLQPHQLQQLQQHFDMGQVMQAAGGGHYPSSARPPRSDDSSHGSLGMKRRPRPASSDDAPADIHEEYKVNMGGQVLRSHDSGQPRPGPISAPYASQQWMRGPDQANVIGPGSTAQMLSPQMMAGPSQGMQTDRFQSLLHASMTTSAAGSAAQLPCMAQGGASFMLGQGPRLQTMTFREQGQGPMSDPLTHQTRSVGRPAAAAGPPMVQFMPDQELTAITAEHEGGGPFWNPNDLDGM